MPSDDWTAGIADWADNAWRAASEIVEDVLVMLTAVLGTALLFAALAAAGLLAGELGLLLIFLAFIACIC